MDSPRWSAPCCRSDHTPLIHRSRRSRDREGNYWSNDCCCRNDRTPMTRRTQETRGHEGTHWSNERCFRSGRTRLTHRYLGSRDRVDTQKLNDPCFRNDRIPWMARFRGIRDRGDSWLKHDCCFRNGRTLYLLKRVPCGPPFRVRSPAYPTVEGLTRGDASARPRFIMSALPRTFGVAAGISIVKNPRGTKSS